MSRGRERRPSRLKILDVAERHVGELSRCVQGVFSHMSCGKYQKLWLIMKLAPLAGSCNCVQFKKKFYFITVCAVYIMKYSTKLCQIADIALNSTMFSNVVQMRYL